MDVDRKYVEAAMADAMALTGLPPCKTLPRVFVETPWEAMLRTGRNGILGAYTWADHEIVLVSPWNWNDIPNRCTLVHEMVHALQRDYLAVNDVVDSTMAMQAERQAYAAQFKWLHMHGRDDLDTLQPLAASMLARETGLSWQTPVDRQFALSYATKPPSV